MGIGDFLMVRGLPFGTACDKKTSSANKCEPVCKTCCKSFICVDAFVGKSVVQPHPSPENLSFAVNWTAFSRLLTLQNHRRSQLVERDGHNLPKACTIGAPILWHSSCFGSFRAGILRGWTGGHVETYQPAGEQGGEARLH